MSFSSMKKNSQSDFERLSKEMAEQGTKKGGFQKDERFWSLTRDKTGAGMAVIRFLPRTNVGEPEYVELHTHGFQAKGGWLIENCPTTIGRKCPICEENGQHWANGDDGKKIARDRKRKLSYLSNILVVTDAANRENEGKVFVFKYGKKIFDKLQETINQLDPDEPKFNPFDFWKGANFKLKAHLESGFVSYEKSGFATQTALFEGDDAKLEALWKKEYSLKEFIAEDQFKSYEELKNRLETVLNTSSSVSVKAEDTEPKDFRSKTENKSEKSSSKKIPKTEEDDDEENPADFFKNLRKSLDEED